jgi:hypothetical protein
LESTDDVNERIDEGSVEIKDDRAGRLHADRLPNGAHDPRVRKNTTVTPKPPS